MHDSFLLESLFGPLLDRWWRVLFGSLMVRSSTQCVTSNPRVLNFDSRQILEPTSRNRGIGDFSGFHEFANLVPEIKYSSLKSERALATYFPLR